MNYSLSDATSYDNLCLMLNKIICICNINTDIICFQFVTDIRTLSTVLAIGSNENAILLQVSALITKTKVQTQIVDNHFFL